ncbi:MAG: helix-hairpin-helix domain-containing protein, partial [Candidatus Tectomicrobia bacterium]|nr:helix-hairpin-helix domain-containing protein [Candidatus Tectomicrobia bacterium]
LPAIAWKTSSGEGDDLQPAPVSVAVPREAVVEEAPAADSTPETPAEVPPESVQRDHLEDITGIGPAYASRLNEAGIMTFAALAEFTPEQIREILNSPTIDAESWIAQARELADGGE